jgi:hypothetical protein
MRLDCLRNNDKKNPYGFSTGVIFFKYFWYMFGYIWMQSPQMERTCLHSFITLELYRLEVWMCSAVSIVQESKFKIKVSLRWGFANWRGQGKKNPLSGSFRLLAEFSFLQLLDWILTLFLWTKFPCIMSFLCLNLLDFFFHYHLKKILSKFFKRAYVIRFCPPGITSILFNSKSTH